jgi:hypothetical protein
MDLSLLSMGDTMSFMERYARMVDTCNNLHGHRLSEEPEPKKTMQPGLKKFAHECKDCLARLEILITNGDVEGATLQGAAMNFHCRDSWHS